MNVSNEDWAKLKLAATLARLLRQLAEPLLAEAAKREAR
jgi:hypothetical protein